MAGRCFVSDSYVLFYFRLPQNVPTDLSVLQKVPGVFPNVSTPIPQGGDILLQDQPSTGDTNIDFLRDGLGSRQNASSLVVRAPDIVVGILRFYRDSSSSSSSSSCTFYLFLVSYPPSPLNGSQPKPATWSEFSAI